MCVRGTRWLVSRPKVHANRRLEEFSKNSFIFRPKIERMKKFHDETSIDNQQGMQSRVPDCSERLHGVRAAKLENRARR